MFTEMILKFDPTPLEYLDLAVPWRYYYKYEYEY